MRTPDLFMLRLDPNPVDVARWTAAEKLDRRGHDDGYGWHALLNAAFGEHAPKPFRFVAPTGARSCIRRDPYLVGYSAADEATLREQASRFADPGVASALRLDRLAVKRMPETFETGLRLGFEVRVCPTVRQDKDGDRRKSRERDAFLAAVDRAGPRGERDELVRADVYRDWLRGRIEAGGAAELMDATLVALRRTRLLRRNGDRKLMSIEKKNAQQNGGGPDATFTGVLRVGDPAVFRALLTRGVGRHRAFGFGMLLLKPAPKG